MIRNRKKIVPTVSTFKFLDRHSFLVPIINDNDDADNVSENFEKLNNADEQAQMLMKWRFPWNKSYYVNKETSILSRLLVFNVNKKDQYTASTISMNRVGRFVSNLHVNDNNNMSRRDFLEFDKHMLVRSSPRRCFLYSSRDEVHCSKWAFTTCKVSIRPIIVSCFTKNIDLLLFYHSMLISFNICILESLHICTWEKK